jgi:hypothetical protein
MIKLTAMPEITPIGGASRRRAVAFSRPKPKAQSLNQASMPSFVIPKFTKFVMSIALPVSAKYKNGVMPVYSA